MSTVGQEFFERVLDSRAKAVRVVSAHNKGETTMSQASLGQLVTYNLNDDGCPSPAIVIRTAGTTSSSIPLPAGIPILGPGQVDLLVHGLMRDYRKHGVYFSEDHQAGCWS